MGGRDDAQRTVLVPSTHQPIGGQCGRFAPTGDEPVEAAAGDRGEPRLAGDGKQGDDIGGHAGAVRQLGAERAYDLLDRSGSRNPSIGEARQPSGGVVVCPLERRLARIHPGTMSHSPVASKTRWDGNPFGTTTPSRGWWLGEATARS